MNISVVANEWNAVHKPQSRALKSATDLESEKKRLLIAAKEMESLFLYQLLKTMRQTIPESESDNCFGSGNGLGKDIYTQMFDQELAMKMAGIGDKSLSIQLYKSLERVLEQQFDESGEVKKVNIEQALPRRKYLKVKQEAPTEINLKPAVPITSENIKPQSGFDAIIRQVADKYQLNPELITAVIKAESNGNPKAVSTAGAKGLMQLVDTTASDMGVKNVFDPRENIEGGAKYLRKMINRFGDVKMALAAYNAGPETVKRYEGIPPYKETINYVNKVMKNITSQKLYY